MTTISATRFHDFSAGHRVHGHENKCAHLHGHNYRVHFTVEPDTMLDAVGRVLDFSVIHTRLCLWLEDHWDHRFLFWIDDPVMKEIRRFVGPGNSVDDTREWRSSAASFVALDFNPTAELMAHHLLTEIGPTQLSGTGTILTRVVVEETRKCSAEASLRPRLPL